MDNWFLCEKEQDRIFGFFPGGHLSIVLFIYWYYPVDLVILEFMQYILLLAIFICTKGLLRYCFR